MLRKVVSTLFPPDQNALDVEVLDIWNKNATYHKTIGKSKTLAATLSDTEPEDDSNDNDDEGILNAFTSTVDPTDGVLEIVDDEEDSVDSRFEKMDDQDDIHTAYEKLYKVSKKHEKLYRLPTKKLSVHF